MDYGATLKYSISAWRLSSQHVMTIPWRSDQPASPFGKNEALLGVVFHLARLGALGSKRQSALAGLGRALSRDEM